MTEQELLSYAPFYKLDSRKISYREYWRSSSGLGPFLTSVANKLRGRQVDLQTYACRLDRLVRLEGADTPHLLRGAIEQAVQQRRYRVRLHYTTPQLDRTARRGCVLADGENPWLLHLEYSSKVGRESLHATLLSRLRGGRLFSSTDHRPQLDGPREDLCFIYPGVELMQLERMHRKQGLTHPPQPLGDPDVERLVVELHNRVVDDKIRRGYYLKCDTEEVRASVARLQELGLA